MLGITHKSKNRLKAKPTDLTLLALRLFSSAVEIGLLINVLNINSIFHEHREIPKIGEVFFTHPLYSNHIYKSSQS